MIHEISKICELDAEIYFISPDGGIFEDIHYEILDPDILDETFLTDDAGSDDDFDLRCQELLKLAENKSSRFLRRCKWTVEKAKNRWDGFKQNERIWDRNLAITVNFHHMKPDHIRANSRASTLDFELPTAGDE